MSYIDDIKNYVCFNEQEEKDKEIILDFILKNDNVLSRQNKIAHITSSSWIINQDKTKVLMVFHKIYNSYSWTGGHSDMNPNLLEVSIREAREEAGIEHIKPVMNDIFSLEILPVRGHIKNNEYVSPHLHLNITYLLVADESDELSIKEDENEDVKWFFLKDALTRPSEEWMVENIYKKLNKKLENINNITGEN